ncbi:hypothetical protein [Paraburkholderia humisilvae]|uniref:hypothetical protein n=1 Tax=Paraburkholderia humisilvae TaxID=627669 RepID=UPI0035E98131
MSLTVQNQSHPQNVSGNTAFDSLHTDAKTKAHANSHGEKALRNSGDLSDAVLKSMNPCGNVVCTCSSKAGSATAQAAGAVADQQTGNSSTALQG